MIEEEVARIATPAHSFEEMFELSMKFLSSPYDIWEKGDLMVKKTVLRLVFSNPLMVSRKKGVQTGETTYPFNALAYLDRTNKNVVPIAGIENIHMRISGAIGFNRLARESQCLLNYIPISRHQTLSFHRRTY